MAKEEKKLTLDEMQDVAGGTIGETYLDGDYLKQWGVIKEVSCSNVRKAFETYGVKLKDHGGLFHGNEYFIKGKQVSHEDALKHVAKKLGKKFNGL